MPKIEPKVDLGHILTLIGFLIVGGIAYGKLESNINNIHENGSKAYQQTIIRLTTNLAELTVEVRFLREQIQELKSDKR